MIHPAMTTLLHSFFEKGSLHAASHVAIFFYSSSQATNSFVKQIEENEMDNAKIIYPSNAISHVVVLNTIMLLPLYFLQVIANNAE